MLQATRYTVLWGLLIVAFTTASLFLFFWMARRQVKAKRIHFMHEEISVLFEKAPCGYHSVDGEGTIVNANETLLRWLGYQKEEVVGKIRFADLVDDSSADIETKINSLPQGRNESIEADLIQKSGGRFPVLLRAMPSAGLTSDPHKRLFCTTDNSQCREALDRIKKLDQELEAFSYSISHDLRAPLRSIDGYSRILQEDYAGRLDDEGRRVLGVVINNARRMGKLIDDLLDFGRVGRRAMQPALVNMSGIVSNIVRELKGLQPDRKIEIETEELLPAFADADMMRQVWFNVLENAVKYSGKKDASKILVRSYRANDSEICYEVRDNGVGFDMQYAGKLFGVFQRLHKMQDFSGTGVGLAIVQRILTRHGGRIWAEAVLNEGATFYFTLPSTNES